MLSKTFGSFLSQRFLTRLVLASGLLAAPLSSARGAEPEKTAQSKTEGKASGSNASATLLGPKLTEWTASRKKGIDYLRNSQSDDGSWTLAKNAGITGLVITALLDSGVALDDPMIVKGLAHLETYIQKDGGIYFKGSGHRNYETCIALIAFQRANGQGKYARIIKNAEKFLRDLQWDQGEGIESSDTKFGGAGYGSHQRPDLSNTQFLIEALKAAGAKDDDPAIQKALVFVSRTQNLETEHNSTKYAAKVNDGGFYYTPAAGGSSQAGMTDNGGLRSYGSMTYAGLKSMIYAGLKPSDPRVKAAMEWIRRNYTVSDNPPMGKQGVLYYHQTFAKTLSVMKLEYLIDSKGVRHDWRKELAEELFRTQQKNGSWVNTKERWYEGDPNLATAYVLMALSHCKPVAAGSGSR